MFTTQPGNFMRFSFLALIVTMSCLQASADTPVYSGDFIETDTENISRFWVADQDTVNIRFQSNETKAILAGGGRTAGTFWINSNGKVTSVDIEKSEPPGVFDKATIRNLKGRSYTPTPENSQRRPAKVSFENQFNVTVK
jgi:TonB family protein